MKNLRVQICAGLVLAAGNSLAFAQTQPTPQAPAVSTVPVSPDNFNRAETDMNFAGGGGKESQPGHWSGQGNLVRRVT